MWTRLLICLCNVYYVHKVWTEVVILLSDAHNVHKVWTKLVILCLVLTMYTKCEQN
jgi:hypothetical protein